jgi:hypothetical protein
MPEAPLAFRRARAEDVPDIVRMLADDPLGATRERDVSPLPDSYALIEGVRVDSGERSRGSGKALFEWAIARGFYEALGFVASHEGMKLRLG